MYQLLHSICGFARRAAPCMLDTTVPASRNSLGQHRLDPRNGQSRNATATNVHAGLHVLAVAVLYVIVVVPFCPLHVKSSNYNSVPTSSSTRSASLMSPTSAQHKQSSACQPCFPDATHSHLLNYVIFPNPQIVLVNKVASSDFVISTGKDI